MVKIAELFEFENTTIFSEGLIIFSTVGTASFCLVIDHSCHLHTDDSTRSHARF